MRMISRQQHVQPGDVIPYIVCEVRSLTKLYRRKFAREKGVHHMH